MDWDSPSCGVLLQWAANAAPSHTYAIVSVGAMAAVGNDLFPVPSYYDQFDICLVPYCPGSYVAVFAYPNPTIDDAFLPSDWTMDGGIFIVGSRTIELVSRGNVGVTFVTATSGTSWHSVVIIVYEAKVELDADQGSRSLRDVGHVWWNLSITPTDTYPYLVGTDPDTGDLVGLSSFGPQGLGGYYDDGRCNWAAKVVFGPQPDFQDGGYYTASGTHYYTFDYMAYIASLQYVYDLWETPGVYTVIPPAKCCTTEAEAVAQQAGITFPENLSYWPYKFSDYLNGLGQNPQLDGIDP